MKYLLCIMTSLLTLLSASCASHRPHTAPVPTVSADTNPIKGSTVDVLSDTMGVDFGPYLARILSTIRGNWYNLIPEEARAPLMRKGEVTIEFAIMQDGKVAGLKVTESSSDPLLDRAAFGSITLSNPLPPLPEKFTGTYLRLRFHFLYNPDKSGAAGLH